MAADRDRDELLGRVGAHMSRQDEVFERFERAFERNTKAFERNTEAFERNARAWGHAVAAMKAIQERLEDMRDEIRANTQAVLRVLDRWDGDATGA